VLLSPAIMKNQRLGCKAAGQLPHDLDRQHP
jgi:hypothetical protein